MSSNSRYINVVDRIAISQNKFLLIVEIQGEYLLVSVSDNNISVLKELDQFVEEAQAEEKPNVNFGELLKNNIFKNNILKK